MARAPQPPSWALLGPVLVGDDLEVLPNVVQGFFVVLRIEHFCLKRLDLLTGSANPFQEGRGSREDHVHVSLLTTSIDLSAILHHMGFLDLCGA